MDNRAPEPILSQRETLPGGDRSGPERGPWPKWHVAAFSDKVACLHVAAAIILSATALFLGPGSEATGRWAFPMLPLFPGALYLIALIAMFVSRERHGLARALLVLGAAFLAVTALWFGRTAPAGRLLVAYWIPALLGITGAIVLQWGHRMAHSIESDFEQWRRQHRSA